MDPKDILFSTPTLNDVLPTALGAAAAGKDCHQMHEDNWRQFEFVSGKFDKEIESELAAIDRIWKEQSVPVGEGMTAFRNVHVRKAITRPLDITFTLADFEQMFGAKASPITIHGYERILADVHAIRLENVVVYAEISAGRLVTLGLEPVDRFALPEDVVDRVEKFVITNDLRLVHWNSRTMLKTPKEMLRYLRGNKR
jgi:hypothetical protein